MSEFPVRGTFIHFNTPLPATRSASAPPGTCVRLDDSALRVPKRQKNEEEERKINIQKLFQSEQIQQVGMDSMNSIIVGLYKFPSSPRQKLR